MKPFITYILIFLATCLSAQSVGDEHTLNRVDLSNDKMNFSKLGDTSGVSVFLKKVPEIVASAKSEKSKKSDNEPSVESDYVNIYSEGEFRASLNAVSGHYLQESDSRNKKDIRPLKDDILQKLLRLDPISYLMKNQENRDRSIGLMAKDVREVFPSLVHYVEGEAVLAVSYSEMIPILIKAIQEQQNTIENLRKNQYAMQKEFAIFHEQMADIIDAMEDQKNTFQKGEDIIAHNN